MFKLLKEKISNWTKKFAKAEAEEETEEDKDKTKTEKKKEKETKKAAKSKKEKKSKKAKKSEKKAAEKKPEEEVVEEKEEQTEKRQETAEEKQEDILEDLEESEKESTEAELQQDKEEEKKSIFGRIKERVSKTTISEKDFDSYAEELEILLLENNVAFDVVDKILSQLKEKLLGKEFQKKELENAIKASLKESIEDVLVEPFDLVEKVKEKKSKNEPYVILFCGVNGSGKTTTLAKIAHLLQKNSLSCVIAAADTFRAASIEQLKQHGEKLGVKVISQQYGADPAAVGFDAINYAKKHFIDCVLIDTAGRMHTAKNLLKEMEKIARVCQPDAKIFIGESITGNDSVEQAKSFNESIGIDGIILTKADVDEKGGTALSVGYITKKPILYLGIGQGYDDLEPFNREGFIEKLGL